MLKEPLLTNEPSPPFWISRESLGIVCLIVQTGLAASGTTCLKWFNAYGGFVSLCMGYLLQVLALILYPVTLSFLPLRVVIVGWTAVANANAVLSGSLLFGEALNRWNVLGCGMSVCSILLTTVP